MTSSPFLTISDILAKHTAHHSFIHMCCSTTLIKELSVLERDMNRRMEKDTCSARVYPDDDRSIVFERVSALSRPFWPVTINDRPDVFQMYRWGFVKTSIADEDEAREWIRQWPSFNAISEDVGVKAAHR